VEASRAEEHGTRLDGGIAYVHQEGVWFDVHEVDAFGLYDRDVFDLLFVLEMIFPRPSSEPDYDIRELENCTYFH
jgi:hypothetical protein